MPPMWRLGSLWRGRGDLLVLYAGAATSTLAVLVWMVGLAAYFVGMSWF